MNTQFLCCWRLRNQHELDAVIEELSALLSNKFYKRFEERFALEKDADGSGAQLPGPEAVRQLHADQRDLLLHLRRSRPAARRPPDGRLPKEKDDDDLCGQPQEAGFLLASGWLAGFWLAFWLASGWFGWLLAGFLAGFLFFSLFFLARHAETQLRGILQAYLGSLCCSRTPARSVLGFEPFAGRGRFLDGRVLGACQVEWNPFGKPPLKRERERGL